MDIIQNGTDGRFGHTPTPLRVAPATTNTGDGRSCPGQATDVKSIALEAIH